MEIGVNVQIHDLLTNSKTLLKEGNARLESNVLWYSESDNPHVLNRVEINDSSILIQRKGEQESLIKIDLNKCDKATVRSEIGTIEFVSKGLYLDIKDDKWIVEYQLFNNDELINHTRVIWELRGINNEQN